MNLFMKEQLLLDEFSFFYKVKPLQLMNLISRNHSLLIPSPESLQLGKAINSIPLTS